MKLKGNCQQNLLSFLRSLRISPFTIIIIIIIIIIIQNDRILKTKLFTNVLFKPFGRYFEKNFAKKNEKNLTK